MGLNHRASKRQKKEPLHFTTKEIEDLALNGRHRSNYPGKLIE